jgi:mRNA-degrading endonuclease HigB of HigAB toxin-antitoxin module
VARPQPFSTSPEIITAINFDTGKIFILDILTHAEYSKNHWKKSL